MKIFLDTEFYEHGNRNYGLITVELISLGAVREDGEEFYAENSAFDWRNVPTDHWIWENVRPHLSYSGGTDDLREATTVVHGPARIAQEFWEFATGDAGSLGVSRTRPEFWGYFCDYDWVVLCGLFGRMVDLPPEFPMYCLDLKQEMKRLGVKRDDLPAQAEGNHHALEDARWIRDAYNFLPGDEMSESLRSV